MKKALLFCTILVLSVGCTNIVFDGHQYDTLIGITEKSDAAALNCGNTDLTKLAISDIRQTLQHEYVYAANRINDDQRANAIKDLINIADGMIVRYNQTDTPSVAYCQAKFNNISVGATTLFKVIGRM